LPISDKYQEYANSVVQQLKNADIRVSIDDRNEKIGKKIRDTEIAKVPYMLIIGEKEMQDDVVSVRRQGKGDAGTVSVSTFLEQVVKEKKDRKSDS
jgi:threonyl-tRNA synthetase